MSVGEGHSVQVVVRAGHVAAGPADNVGDGGITVAALCGEITGATAPALREQLPGLVPAGGRLRLDLSQVTYISSAGLRVLVLLHREAREQQAVVELAGLREELRFVLVATGFLDLLTLAADCPEADTASLGGTS